MSSNVDTDKTPKPKPASAVSDLLTEAELARLEQSKKEQVAYCQKAFGIEARQDPPDPDADGRGSPPRIGL